MINFYKNNGGLGTIQFASGDIITLSDDVNVRADNTTNQIIISEFNRDKFWINTSGELRVSGTVITGTNQQKVDLIAPIFAEAAGTGTGTSTPLSDNLTTTTTGTALDARQGSVLKGQVDAKVPLTRTITINGTPLDLSADRSWTITPGATIASTAEAIAGTDDTKAMSPLKSMQVIQDQAKYYQKEASVNTAHEVSFYMAKAGTLTNVVSIGLVTLERKLNSGTYGPATYPFTYAAGDVIYYSFGYSDSVVLMGNIILIGKDN